MEIKNQNAKASANNLHANEKFQLIILTSKIIGGMEGQLPFGLQSMRGARGI